MDTPVLDLSVPPFNLLNESQVQRLSTGLHLEYFEAGQTIIEAGASPEGIYLIIKGKVEEYDGDSVERDSLHMISQFSDGDLFGSLAVLKGQARTPTWPMKRSFVRLPARFWIWHENAEFRHYFHKGLATMSKHWQAGGDREGDDFSLVRRRVCHA